MHNSGFFYKFRTAACGDRKNYIVNMETIVSTNVLFYAIIVGCIGMRLRWSGMGRNMKEITGESECTISLILFKINMKSSV